MKFGQQENPGSIDFRLPVDDNRTTEIHMRLTTPKAFIRYVGANHPQNDRERLDDWIIRLESWVNLGIRDIYFFVHQNIELESPFLSAYFIEKLNSQLGLSLQIPQLLNFERELF